MSAEDIEAIRQLKARYFRFVDTKQWDRWGELFTEDAVLDVPLMRGEPLRGRRAIEERVRQGLIPMITIHHGHTPEIELDGPDRARGIWPMYDKLLRTTLETDAPGFGPRYEGSGHYVERYAKDGNGRWRIARCELRRLHLETERHRRDSRTEVFEGVA
jgi:ketosteroid isomerase-like protein